jgi:type I restriction enzyme S subunit
MQGSTHKTIYMPDLEDLRISFPPLAEQRAIADYLDAETARIDALITKKQQLIHLLDERRHSALDEVLAESGVHLPNDLDPQAVRSLTLPEGWRVTKLSSVLRQLTNGFVGPTRDILADDGVRYIQGLHIKRGSIDFERRPFYVAENWHHARPRTSLRPGDVVIVQTGDIGQCAVVPEGFGEANCHALLIARVEPNLTDGNYLATYLQSRFGRHSLLRLATGALHPHLEFGIRDVPLLLPPKAEQARIVDGVRSEVARLDAASTSLARQIGLLAEHRQALITAAVAGEFTAGAA